MLAPSWPNLVILFFTHVHVQIFTRCSHNTMFHISTQRPILCSHSSSQIPILHSMYTLYVLTSQVRNPLYTIVHFIVLTSQVRNIMYTPHWNTLPYIGKFDGQTAFGIYGLAATYGHNNTNQALQPCCNTHTIHCGYG